MTALADAALFVCGFYLSIRGLAAAYRVLDLWYTIRTAWPSVVRGLLVWGGAIVLLAALLEGRHLTAFASGLVAYLLFYLSLYLARRLLVRKPDRV